MTRCHLLHISNRQGSGGFGHHRRNVGDEDLLTDGATSTERGTATEIFVQQDAKWINTGWQLAPARKGAD